MAKYKLTVKYQGVCELSIAGDIPNIIQSEFDQYVKSILYKKEEWENFETNFKEAAKLEYGDPRKLEEPVNELEEEIQEINEEAICEPVEEAEIETVQETVAEFQKEDIEEPKKVEETIQDNPPEEKTSKKSKKSRMELISFVEYIDNKNINTPLDEFVAGACYLDKVLNIQEFSLKQINAKLYPVFKRLASSIVIEEAVERVLIETIEENNKVRYKINQNAWNYHDYDLVKQTCDE